jgi:N-acetylneuraminic acid mutarotase
MKTNTISAKAIRLQTAKSIFRMISMAFAMLFMLSILFIGIANPVFAQSPGTWIQKSDIGGAARARAVGFSIGDKGYLGTGTTAEGIKKDFWEYDPVADSWTQKADFGGTARSGAVGFSIGSKGYIGTGETDYPEYHMLKDFWEYDPDANSWTRKKDFGGSARCWSAGFAAGNKGYIGTGINEAYLKDFWEYDPAKNTWTRKAQYPGVKGSNLTAFSIGDKGYMGMSFNFYTNTWWQKDFYEYDPSTNTWTRKANFGDGRRDWTAAFSIGTKGYVGTGMSSFDYKNDFWEYDPADNEWTEQAEFRGIERIGAIAFSIGSKGYIGTGEDYYGAYLNDFWEYTPDVTLLCKTPSTQSYTSITPASAVLNWESSSTALYYEIEYAIAEGNGTAITKNAVSHNIEISNLLPNTLYSWHVKSICATDSFTSSDWSEMQYFTTEALKVSGVAAATLTLYPNPVSEKFLLHLKSAAYNDQTATIYLLNTLGQVVYSLKDITANGEINQVITMPATAASGWYVVRVVMSDQVIEQKLLYQK